MSQTRRKTVSNAVFLPLNALKCLRMRPKACETAVGVALAVASTSRAVLSLPVPPPPHRLFRAGAAFPGPLSVTAASRASAHTLFAAVCRTHTRPAPSTDLRRLCCCLRRPLPAVLMGVCVCVFVCVCRPYVQVKRALGKGAFGDVYKVIR